MPDVYKERLSVTGSQERALAGGWYHVGWLQSHVKLPTAPTSEPEEQERQQAASDWSRGESQQHSLHCVH